MPSSRPQNRPEPCHALRVRRVRVRRGKLDLELAIPLEFLHVSERTAARVLDVLPNLERHVCVNGRGETLGDEIVGTELAHLLEHMVIELQGQAHGAGARGERARAGFQGHTSWADELANTRPQGIALMRTTVTFENDLVALQAVKDACAVLDWAVLPSGDSREAPDIPAMVAALRRMM